MEPLVFVSKSARAAKGLPLDGVIGTDVKLDASVTMVPNEFPVQVAMAQEDKMRIKLRANNGLPRIGKRTSPDGSRIEWNLESSPSYIRRFNAKGIEISYVTGSIPESELSLVLRMWGKRYPVQLKFL